MDATTGNVTATQSDQCSDDIERDLLSFFDERGGLPGTTVAEQLDCEFFTAGIITSMGLVELVMHLERIYRIPLGPDDLQSPAFQTCRGVAELVRERMAS